MLPIKRHELALPRRLVPIEFRCSHGRRGRRRRTIASATFHGAADRHCATLPLTSPSIMPPHPFTLHLACLPGFGGGDAGHLMRIRMTSLSLQPNDASTLQPSLNAVQWCGVDCPLHLLVYSLILTLVIVSPSRRAEEQDMHAWCTYSTGVTLDLSISSTWSRLKAKGGYRPLATGDLKRPFFSSLGY